MTIIDDLRQADTERRAAIVDGDANATSQYLADDLTWTHSSGKTDSKESFLAILRSGATVYRSLDVRDTQARQFGELCVMEGVIFGDITKDGIDKHMVNRFIAVWRRNGSEFKLHAWQSTGLS